MKIGYQYAIEVLLAHYRKLESDHADQALIQQIRRGSSTFVIPGGKIARSMSVRP